jgi:uncharacterized protein (DUF362 family)/NAD-dependent dihydropyrimidine dehydrogenase PreA subunit
MLLDKSKMMLERPDQDNGDSPTLQNKGLKRVKVSLVRAHDYEFAQIYAALTKAIESIGKLQKIFKPGARVFVKINHLSPPSPAERGIVTHPVFVEAVLELLKVAGADITVGDDIDSGTRDGFEVSGIRQMCQRAGVRLANLREAGFVEVSCNGLLLDKLYVSRIALEADVIVNLPKLKTHSLTVLTGGIKNMYGTIPTGLRTRFHYRYMRSVDFCQMLTDIFSIVRPQLTIMDGILAMEGEGPASGNLRRLGVMLASQDTVALDAVAGKIIGLDPMDVYTTQHAHRRGLGVGDLHQIEVVGEHMEDVVVGDFKLPAAYGNVFLERGPKVLSKFLLRYLLTRQQVQKSRCTGCAECVKACPSGAISIIGKTAIISQSRCINCMCCHEVCRFGAIIPRRPIARRTLDLARQVLRV